MDVQQSIVHLVSSVEWPFPSRAMSLPVRRCPLVSRRVCSLYISLYEIEHDSRSFITSGIIIQCHLSDQTCGANSCKADETCVLRFELFEISAQYFIIASNWYWASLLQISYLCHGSVLSDASMRQLPQGEIDLYEFVNTYSIFCNTFSWSVVITKSTTSAHSTDPVKPTAPTLSRYETRLRYLLMKIAADLRQCDLWQRSLRMQAW